MSQVARQLQLCPGSPRRIRVQNRRLCTCGGVSTPCGPCPACLCVGRSTPGTGEDTCAGEQPFFGIGKSFSVEFETFVITAVDIQYPTSGGVEDEGNAVYIASGRMDICQHPDVIPGSGARYFSIRNFTGHGQISGASRPQYLQPPPPPFVTIPVLDGEYNPALWEPYENVVVNGHTVLCTPIPPYSAGQMMCGLAYPRPRHLLDISRAMLGSAPILPGSQPASDSLYQQWINQWPFPGGPPPSAAQWWFRNGSEHSNFFAVPWYEQACAGSQSAPVFGTGTGAMATHTWSNTVTGRETNLSLTVREDYVLSPHQTGFAETSWTARLRVNAIEACPGDAPDRNAAAIAGFMARGERAGCCG